jgi:hypothetical protein
LDLNLASTSKGKLIVAREHNSIRGRQIRGILVSGIRRWLQTVANEENQNLVRFCGLQVASEDCDFLRSIL